MKNIYIYPSKLQRSWKIIFLCLLTSVCCLQSSLSQTAPGIEWQNTIGGNDEDRLFSIQQTTDGGYILGGYSKSNISGDKTENCIGDYDYWVVKTDSSGNIQWQNTIGGSSDDELYSVKQTFDGGYILGGYSNSNISGDKTENSVGVRDYWIIKLDGLGNIGWQNTIGGSLEDRLFCVDQTIDSGYVLLGESISGISGDKTENSMQFDYWVVKTDASGNIQWQNTIGGNQSEMATTIQQTNDKGYILGGHSPSDSSGDKTENCLGSYDCWIIKIDSIGNIQWDNTIGGSLNDQLNSIQQTTDNGYILGCFSSSDISGDKTENSNGSQDYWIIKIDSAGNIQWQNTIGGSSSDQLYCTRQTTDGAYILGGYSESDISGDKTDNSFGIDDYWIVKTDETGFIHWQKTIGGISFDDLHSLQQTSDGYYILGGRSNSNISGNKTEDCLGDYDYWIVKLGPDTTTSITQLSNYSIAISVYPNPLTNQSKLTFKNPNKEKFLFTLYDITGRITESVSTTNNEIILNKSSKTPDSYREGVYLFNLMNEKTGERWNGKIVVSE